MKLTYPRQKDMGLTDPFHSIKFYKYALIDPLDAPFATFRYLTRDWETLEEMGIIPESYSQDHESLTRPYSISIGSCSEDTSVHSDDAEGAVDDLAGNQGVDQGLHDATSSSSDEIESDESLDQQSEHSDSTSIPNNTKTERQASLTPPPGARFLPNFGVSRYLTRGAWTGNIDDNERSDWRRTLSPVKKVVVETKEIRSPRVLHLRNAVGNAWRRRSMSPIS
jgi:hypothetical protein